MVGTWFASIWCSTLPPGPSHREGTAPEKYAGEKNEQIFWPLAALQRMCFGVAGNRCFSTRILLVVSYWIYGLNTYVFLSYMMACLCSKFYYIPELLFLLIFFNHLSLLRDCLLCTYSVPYRSSNRRLLTSTTLHSSKFQRLVMYRWTEDFLRFQYGASLEISWKCALICCIVVLC